MIAAEALIKHTARLRWVDGSGCERAERHAAWTARRATEMAWRRARSMMTTGEAKAFRIEHSEQVYEGGSVVPFPDAFTVPALEARA